MEDYNMKEYKDRNELTNDVRFIKSIFTHESEYRNKIINILFNRWMETSPDSPWSINEVNNDNAHENLHSLVKINSEGVSNQWKGEHTVFHDFDKKNKVKNPYHSIRYI
tara:strand:+ start:3079 stop:3405 length:327 start_codon:yes stop_codon:yes gene_type:complete